MGEKGAGNKGEVPKGTRTGEAPAPGTAPAGRVASHLAGGWDRLEEGSTRHREFPLCGENSLERFVLKGKVILAENNPSCWVMLRGERGWAWLGFIPGQKQSRILGLLVLPAAPRVSCEDSFLLFFLLGLGLMHEMQFVFGLSVY